MTDLVLFRHPKAGDILLDPGDSQSISDTVSLSPRKLADFLNVSPAELDQIVASGALSLRTTADGKSYVAGADLQKFLSKLQVVGFDEVEVEQLEDDDDEEPIPQRRKKPVKKNVSLDDFDEDVPAKAKPKTEKPKAAKQAEAEADDDEEAEECFVLAPLGSMARLVKRLLKDIEGEGESEKAEKPAAKNPLIFGKKRR